MKKILLMALLCAMADSLKAQVTNTFPADGNVGIGTTTPGQKLEVAGNILVTSGSVIIPTTGRYLFAGTDCSVSYLATNKIGFANAAGDQILTANTGTGCIGIGTTSPGAKLDIHGAGANILLGVDSYIRSSPNINDNGAAFPLQIGPTKDTQTPRYLQFGQWADVNTFEPKMVINGNSGNVGIGTTDPGNYKLGVNGTIHSKAVVVDLIGWSDYVFNKNYQLPTLAQVKNYIDQNHHLPDMPSAEQVEKDGLNLGEMNKVLTKKVEELTLYLIEKDSEIKNQKVSFALQQSEIENLKKDIEMLKSKAKQ